MLRRTPWLLKACSQIVEAMAILGLFRMTVQASIQIFRVSRSFKVRNIVHFLGSLLNQAAYMLHLARLISQILDRSQIKMFISLSNSLNIIRIKWDNQTIARSYRWLKMILDNQEDIEGDWQITPKQLDSLLTSEMLQGQWIALLEIIVSSITIIRLTQKRAR